MSAAKQHSSTFFSKLSRMKLATLFTTRVASSCSELASSITYTIVRVRTARIPGVCKQGDTIAVHVAVPMVSNICSSMFPPTPNARGMNAASWLRRSCSQQPSTYWLVGCVQLEAHSHRCLHVLQEPRNGRVLDTKWSVALDGEQLLLCLTQHMLSQT